MPVAVITGASKGLGRELAHALAEQGWSVVGDARDQTALAAAFAELPGTGHVPVAGDVTDPRHRRDLAEAAARLGGAALLVNNASTLGASPLPAFADLDPATYRAVLETNVVAPLALVRELLPQLRQHAGIVVDLSSDAAVEAYDTWGAYGSSKAALDHASRILAAEEPRVRVYAVDPGDMRTAMHQDAFPGEDISDRPDPSAAVPAFLTLLAGRPPSGRYRACGRRQRSLGGGARVSEAAFRFELPSAGEAASPPEVRGLARDQVRLAVVSPRGVVHAQARDLPDHLHPGDLVVVNTSATLPAAVDFLRHGCPTTLHFSTELDDGSWVVEVRRPDQSGPALPSPGEVLRLPGGLRLRVVEPHPSGQSRLWRTLPLPAVSPVHYLAEHGHPIRYRYLDGEWPIEDLQNVYADRPGSAEMPSAGRPLTDRLLVRMMSRGIALAPIVLHTGVSSQESHEPPQPERFTVPAATARLVNSTRAAGRRVVAVGTTVVRALESATAGDRVVPTSGWTSLVLGPDRPARVVDGLLTGLHEPEASHLHLLEAVAGRALVDAAYAEVTRPDGPPYLWHEFGDSMLLLPR